METFCKENFLIGLREELECTICLDLSIPPIYSCRNGHILCGICYEKIKQCGLCKESFTKNDFAERLLSRHELAAPCRNKSSGCKTDVQVSKMKDHLLTCEYAPVKCFWQTGPECSKQAFNFEEYCQHLVDFHGAKIKKHVGPWTCSLTRNIDETLTDETFKYKLYHCRIIHFQGNKFIFSPMFKNGNLMWCIAIVGSGFNASKYRCTTFIYSSPESAASNVEQDCLCSWNTPILTLKEFPNQDEMFLSGRHASVHWRTLQRAWKEVVIEGTKKRRQWCLKIVIKPILLTKSSIGRHTAK